MYSRAFDDIEALLELLRILFRILAANKDLDRDFAPFQRLKVLGWKISSQFRRRAQLRGRRTFLRSSDDIECFQREDH